MKLEQTVPSSHFSETYSSIFGSDIPTFLFENLKHLRKNLHPPGTHDHGRLVVPCITCHIRGGIAAIHHLRQGHWTI